MEESKNNATGGYCATSHHRIAAEASYQKKAELLLSDENCFKLILYKGEGKLTIEMVDTETDESGDELEQIEKWSDYVERYTREIGNISDELKEQLNNKPVFMRRNIRSFKSRTKNERENLIDQNVDSKSLKKTDEKDNNNDNKSSESGNNEENKNADNDNNNNSNNNIEESKSLDIDKALVDTEVIENSECKFDMNKFKVVFVVQSESVMYRKTSLKRAKMVTKTKIQFLFNFFFNFQFFLVA
jgi:paired amphipathic helix protein Sin3a